MPPPSASPTHTPVCLRGHWLRFKKTLDNNYGSPVHETNTGAPVVQELTLASISTWDGLSCPHDSDPCAPLLGPMRYGPTTTSRGKVGPGSPGAGGRGLGDARGGRVAGRGLPRGPGPPPRPRSRAPGPGESRPWDGMAGETGGRIIMGISPRARRLRRRREVPPVLGGRTPASATGKGSLPPQQLRPRPRSQRVAAVERSCGGGGGDRDRDLPRGPAGPEPEGVSAMVGGGGGVGGAWEERYGGRRERRIW